MTIISTVVVTANQGTDPVELLQHLGKGLARIKSYEGVQEATLSAIAVGGAGTNSMVVMATCEDWTTYGKIQQELNTDSEMIQLMLEGGKMATWQTFTSDSETNSLGGPLEEKTSPSVTSSVPSELPPPSATATPATE